MSHSHRLQVCSMSRPSSLYCDGSTESAPESAQEPGAVTALRERGPSPWKLANLTDLTGAISVWMRSPGTWGTEHPEFRSSLGVAVPELSSMSLEVNALEYGNLESWVQELFSMWEYKYLLIYNTVDCVHSKWMKKRRDILHWICPTHTQKCRLGLHTNYKY